MRRMLSIREDAASEYTPNGFLKSIDPWFLVEQRIKLQDSERTMYLLRGDEAAC